MQLKDILDICRANEVEHFEYTVVNGDINTTVTGIASDSRKVTDGGIFVCIVGSVSDGHKYIEQVKDKAAVIVVQKGSQYNTEKIPAAVIECDNTRLALALMSAAFYGNPDKKLFTIGITGTKGKTTTTYMIKNVLCACGIKTGLIGTIETVIGDEAVPSCNTTPESIQIHKTFRKMVDEGCKAVVMEVSSQGLKLDRTAGIVFDIGVFTNLEPDHIGPNEHASFEEYLECKAKLFKQCKTGIVNADDKHTADILRDSVCSVEKYGITYLKKGGRISGAKAAVGTLLKLRPIITINDIGKLAIYDKAKGTKKGIAEMISILKKTECDFSEPINIVHTDAPELAEELKAAVLDKHPKAKIVTDIMGPVIGAHFGPGSVAFLFKGTDRVDIE